MNIPKINLRFKPQQQFYKIMEETAELAEELREKSIDEDKLIAECFDLIQATYTLIFMFVSDKETLRVYWLEHLKKLQQRFDKGEIEIEEYIEL